MAVVDALASSTLKLQRARVHQDAFVRALRDFYESKPWTVLREHERNDLVLRLRILHNIPASLALIVGDLVHNARSALDCAIIELAEHGLGSAGRPPTEEEERRLYCPVTTTAEDFDRSASRMEPFLPSKTITTMECLQPWSIAQFKAAELGKGSDQKFINSATILDPIRRLHILSNWDKHRRIPLTLWLPQTVAEGATDDELIADHFKPRLPPAGEQLDLPLTFTFPMIEVEEPEYDFFFSGEVVADGVELGRYKRHDGGVMADVEAAASLRISIVEPELRDQWHRAPPAFRATQEFVDCAATSVKFLQRSLH